MFGFFKRSDKAVAAAVPRQRNQVRKTTASRGMGLQEPLAVPEVLEGNLDSDWAMWEDSVREQDSQLSSQFLDTVPSHFSVNQPVDGDPDADPFAKVSKHAP